MTGPIGTLLCWNRAADARAMLWQDLAQGARLVTVDELGPVCRVVLRAPDVPGMVSLAPPELSLVAHGGDGSALAAALRRLLGGARPMLVLSVGAVDDPGLLAAATGALSPDLIDTADAPAALPAAWADAARERGRRRQGVVTRYRVDELPWFDLPPTRHAAAVPVADIPAGRPATVVVPGCDSPAAWLGLHLLAGSDWAGEEIGLSVDGRRVAAPLAGTSAVTRLPESRAAVHVVRIGHDRAGRVLPLSAIAIGPGPCAR